MPRTHIVVIKKHSGYNPSVGFFRHRKHETGFLADADFSTGILSV